MPADNWGAVSTIVLTVDTTGPATSNVVVAPNPNNGTLGVNSSTPAVRVTATVTDLTSSLVRAEGFIEAAGADGTGFLFVPVDGVWNSTTEVVSVDIPLTTIGPMSAGNHPIYVHAKDAAGNWGRSSTVDLVIDKTPPTVVSITLDGPSPATAASVSFTVTFSEAVTGGTSSNFAVVQGGGLFGASITSVTGHRCNSHRHRGHRVWGRHVGPRTSRRRPASRTSPGTRWRRRACRWSVRCTR